MTFGEELRKLREQKGLSLRRLAMLCDVTPSYMSKVERDDCSIPSSEMIRRIAFYVGGDGDRMALRAGRIPEWIRKHLQNNVNQCVEFFESLDPQK